MREDNSYLPSSLLITKQLRINSQNIRIQILHMRKSKSCEIMSNMPKRKDNHARINKQNNK